MKIALLVADPAESETRITTDIKQAEGTKFLLKLLENLHETAVRVMTYICSRGDLVAGLLIFVVHSCIADALQM
jgi:hypothetical protein